MSEREDALGAILDALDSEDDYVRSWKLARQIRNALAAHDERIRAEALAPVRALLSDPANSWWHTGGTPCVPRRALTAVLPPERLAGEVGA